MFSESLKRLLFLVWDHSGSTIDTLFVCHLLCFLRLEVLLYDLIGLDLDSFVLKRARGCDQNGSIALARLENVVDLAKQLREIQLVILLDCSHWDVRMPCGAIHNKLTGAG